MNFVRPRFEGKILVKEKNPPGWDKAYGKEFICVWLSALGIMPNRSSHNLDIFDSLMGPLPSPMPRLPLKEIISKFFQSFKATFFVSSPVEVNNFYGLVLWKSLNLLSVFEQDFRDTLSFFRHATISQKLYLVNIAFPGNHFLDHSFFYKEDISKRLFHKDVLLLLRKLSAHWCIFLITWKTKRGQKGNIFLLSFGNISSYSDTYWPQDVNIL